MESWVEITIAVGLEVVNLGNRGPVTPENRDSGYLSFMNIERMVRAISSALRTMAAMAGSMAKAISGFSATAFKKTGRGK